MRAKRMSDQEGEVSLREGKAMPRWVALLLAMLGGTLTAFAFIPFDWSFLVWVSLIPLLSVLWTARRGFWGSFGYGWIFGLFYFGITFWWVNSVGELFEVPLMMFFCGAYLPFMAYLALYPALWAGIVGTWLRPKYARCPENVRGKEWRESWKEWGWRDVRLSIVPVLGAASLWVVTEWLRGWVMTGFGWNGLGVALYSGLSLAQWAEWIGVVALSFLPVLTNGVLMCVGRRVLTVTWHGGKVSRPWDFYALALVLFTLVIGGVFLSQRYAFKSIMAQDDAQKLPVMAVQGNIPQKERFSMPPLSVCEYLLSLTEDGLMDAQRKAFARAMESGRDTERVLPAWVIWPESSLARPIYADARTAKPMLDFFNQSFLFGKNGIPKVRNDFRKMGGENFVLLSGGDVVELEEVANEQKVKNIRNSLVVFDDGLESARYVNKQHLVPFGEYVPLSDVCPLLMDIYASFSGSPISLGMTPGEGNEPIEIAVPGSDKCVNVIPAVCYEDTLGRLLRRFARHGAQVIVNVTNDGWFLQSCAGRQHARNAAFRAIELRRSLIHAANTGLTVAYAPNGAVIDELKGEDGSPFEAGTLTVELPIDRKASMTLYAVAGDWAVWVCLVAFGVCCVVNRRSGKYIVSDCK